MTEDLLSSSGPLAAVITEPPTTLAKLPPPQAMTYALVITASTSNGMVCMLSARDGEAFILQGVLNREHAVQVAEDIVDNFLGVRFVAALSSILVRGQLWEQHPHTLMTCNIHITTSSLTSICTDYWDGTNEGLASMLKCAHNAEPYQDGHVARLVDRHHLPVDARQRALVMLGMASFLEVGTIENASEETAHTATERSPHWGRTPARTQTNECDRGLPLGTDASLRMLNSALSVASLETLARLRQDSTIGIIDMGACILSGFATAARFLGIPILGGAELDLERRMAYERIHDVELTTDAKDMPQEYISRVKQKAVLLGITHIVVCTSFACQPYSQAGQQRGSDDPRYFAPEEAVALVDAFAASAFICENVPAVPGAWWASTAHLLQCREFNVDSCIRNAYDFGGPTARHRKFLAATAPGLPFTFTLCPRPVAKTLPADYISREDTATFSNTPFQIREQSDAPTSYDGPRVTAVFEGAPPPPPHGKGTLGFTILSPHHPFQTLRATLLDEALQPAGPLGAALATDAPPGTKPRLITPFVGMLFSGFNPLWLDVFSEHLHIAAIGEAIPTELATCTIIEVFASLLCMPMQTQPNADPSLQLHERIIGNQERSALNANGIFRSLSLSFADFAHTSSFADFADTATSEAVAADATAWANKMHSANFALSSDRLLSPIDAGLLSRMPFAHFCKIPATKTPTKPLPKEEHPEGFHPKSYKDIFTEDGISRIRAWFAAEANDLRTFRDAKPGETPHRRNKALALGLSIIKPEARPYRWDLRGTVPKLLGSDAAARERPPMTLNAEAASSLLHDCKDRALLAAISDGVDFQSDHMAHQLVLNPCLISGLQNQGELAAQLAKLTKAGGLRVATGDSPVPFFPCIITPQGVVAKKDSADMRRTCDGGAPRSETFDTDGKKVMAHNDAIAVRQGHDTPRRSPHDVYTCDADNTFDLLDEEPRLPVKFPLEKKPKLKHILNDTAILHLPAMLFHMPVISGTRDFKGFFNIFALHPMEHYKCVYVFLRSVMVDAGLQAEAENFENRFQHDLSIFGEEVLGFGLSASSNIAQRFATAFAEAVLDIFAKTDTPNILAAAETDEQKAWVEERQLLSKSTGRNQLRLVTLHIYTDDGSLTAVGEKRFADFWMLYSRISFQLNIRFSAISKQHLSIQVPFIGFSINSLAGSVSIMEHKRAHVLHHLSTLAAGGAMRFDDLQSLIGTLGHLQEVFTYLTLTPFFSSFSYGNTHGPATIIKVSAEARALAADWINELTTVKSVDIIVVAVSNFIAHEEAELRNTDASALPAPAHHLPLQVAALKSFAHKQPFVVTCFSDACIEGLGERPGIGLFCHGLSMYVPIPEKFVQLGISPLELGGVGLQYFVIAAFFPHIAMSMRTDSSASLQALLKGSSTSPAMRAGVRVIRTSGSAPHTRSFQKELSHQIGLGNLMADALSRALFELYHRLCRQYGVKDVPIEPPRDVYHIFEEMLDAHNAAEADPQQPPRKRVRSGPDPDVNMNGKEYSSNDMGDGPSVASANNHGQTSDAAAMRERIANFHNMRSLKRAAPPRCTTPPQKRRLTQPTEATTTPHRNFGTPNIATRGTIHGPEAAHMVARATAFKELRHTQRNTTPITPLFPWQTNTASTVHLPTKPAKWKSPSPPEHGFMPVSSTTQSTFLPPLVADAFSAADQAPEPATLAKDKRTWTKWTEFCKLANVPVWRPMEHTIEGHRYECTLVIGFIAWLRQTLKPRKKTDRLVNKPVRSDTLQGYISSLRRIYARRNRSFVRPDVMRQVLLGYSKMMVREHGPTAVTPSRPEPLHCQRLARILALANGTKLGGSSGDYILRWNALRYTSIAAMLCLGLACGFRKAEMVTKAHADVAKGHCLSMLSIVYVIAGKNYADPSLDQLKSMNVGDLIIVKPPLAKNDPIGIYFTTKPIYLSWRNHNLNACRRLIALAAAKLRFDRNAKPASATLANTALFCNTNPWSPMTASMADGIFRRMTMQAFDTSLWQHLTLHSLRVGCATAMLKAGASHAEIQAVVRWRSPESVNIYAKTSPEAFAKWGAVAETVHANTSETQALCTIDLSDADREQLIADAHADMLH